MKLVRNYKIDYLKAIAATFVVIGHCISHLDKYNLQPTSTLSIISISVSSVHVPLFIAIAGFLSCPRSSEFSYSQYYTKKIRRVFYPFISFTILKVIFNQFISSDFSHGANTFDIIFDYFIIGKGYWFVYCILILFAIAPIFWLKGNTSLRNWNIRFAILFLGLVLIDFAMIDYPLFTFPDNITLAGLALPDPFFQIKRTLMYLPYFLFGMMIRYNKVLVSLLLKKYQSIILAASCFVFLIFLYLVQAGIFKKGYTVKMAIAFSFMTILFYFVSIIPGTISFLSRLGTYSLHIMFFDSFYRVILYYIIFKFVTPSVYFALIICIFDVILSYFSTYVVSKIPWINKCFGL